MAGKIGSEEEETAARGDHDCKETSSQDSTSVLLSKQENGAKHLTEDSLEGNGVKTGLEKLKSKETTSNGLWMSYFWVCESIHIFVIKANETGIQHNALRCLSVNGTDR